MNISYNWLKRYIDTDLGAEEVARILTDIGLEVEGFEKIETIKGGLAGVVVGEVLTCEDHPDSDHLHVTTVDVGTGEPLQIVCGAPNCRAGLKVLCATVGTVLYPGGGDEEFKIKRSKIRGVESLGMLCAEDELGIGASHDGIMELPADAVAGTTARDYLRIEDDYLIEVGLTPNRVDAASHIGVARDLAAYLRSRGEDVSVKMPDVSAFAPDNHDLGVKIRVENHEAAPRYAGVTVKNCKIAPSPEWMQNCLRAAGINPKNNLVDITNFVLFELGQPLHAFDAAKIEGREVVVRTCAEGTPFVTLDGVERKLTADDLMICSAERPMCIAGVFGGLDSGISDTTTDVFIESAYFNPVWVRKTAKRFGLNTDSSFRFERGVDPNMQVYAAKRAALLMKELAGGEISSDITDIYPRADRRFPLRRLVCPHRRADRQAYPRRNRPCDPRGARSEGAGREGRRAERGRAALPGRRAARGRPHRGYPAHLRLQQRRDPLARPFDAFLCAQTRPQPPDEPRRRLPIGQRLYGDHVQLADQGGLLRRAGEL